ncbi:hypothetical protein [Suicoccus acidiformans]|uniref:hypothetical protein n=1 Tax=Suicoccus acidiformans TaxID=2036206 RepID=UPI0013C2D832|nr:hypothetical protein [Suicoccus acidiformans]
MSKIQAYNGIDLTFVSLRNYSISKDERFKHWWRFFRLEESFADAPEVVREAYEAVNPMNMTEEEREIAELAKRYQDDYAADMSTAWIEGKEEGEKKGRAEGRYELVSTMHENGLSIEEIARYTNLTEAEVESALRVL